jgi:hypothetical protein
MSSELPPFAAQWIKQWKEAGPRLQAIRDEELRRLGENSKKVDVGCLIYEKYPEAHGMVTSASLEWLVARG